jgi:magnesium-protoporphyrin O-methyltransferase
MCGATERQFGEKRAANDLQQYRATGPGPTTRLLLGGLTKTAPVQGLLLDIGSGVGAVTFELLKQGMTNAVGVDLSSAYVAAASGEATRLGRSDSVRFMHADFLDVASDIPPADVVTLDRVVCCYPEHERLLDESLRHADRYLALSYPRDVWYVRFWVTVENVGRQIRRNAFRTFVHSATTMENRIRRTGFQLVNRSRTWTWCADVYVRS